ncbi:hypothetical protein C8R42DRAFT_649204 [Lentinula raphanica]|nr:hypothetical protein C8R42DRAFT_649204 [Lentinula raphanica]
MSNASSIPPLSYATYRLHPDILTRFSDPASTAWLIPSAEDFDAEASDFLYNAVVLDTTVYLRLKALADDVLKTINLSEFQSDPYLTQGSLQVDRMLSLLQVAAPREDILLRVAFLQRSILELDARIQYRSQDWNTVIIGKKRNYEIPDCLAVIGAFTDNSSTADTLYCLGIPVCSRIIELPSGFRMDGTDAEPSHKIIWEGPTNKPECFVAMNAYLQSLLYPSSVFGSHQMQSLSSFQKAISTRATLNHSAGHASSSGLNHPNSTLRSSMRPAPYSQKNRKQPQLHKQGINTFLQLKSPAMPPAISAWARALEYHSTYNQSLRRPETLNLVISSLLLDC